MNNPNSLEKEIENISKKFLEKIKDKEIKIISHFDTDGITSAAIIIQTLKKLDQRFSVKIIKSLEKEFIDTLPKNQAIIFLDLASENLNNLAESNIQNIFIIDHHEITQEIPTNITMLNPHLYEKQKLSSSALTYLFCKQINPKNKEFVKLAVLGMIGDKLEKELGILEKDILEDKEIKSKKGLLTFPATRSINRSLEFCSNPYIPTITGNVKGILELLRRAKLEQTNGKYKSIIELDEKEMSNLIKEIKLINPTKEIIGDIFLIKLFEKFEDARELSGIINACSKSKESSTALQFCMKIAKAKQTAETIHAKQRQLLIASLKIALESPKIQGKGFVIINTKDEVPETIIGTIATIIANSNSYEEGTIIITMANYDDKTKISARSVGNNTRNIREVLERVIEITGGQTKGHKLAAGGIINKEKEQEFIEVLKKHLEIEMVKI